MNTSTPIYGEGRKSKPLECSSLTSEPSKDAVELSEYMSNLNVALNGLLANRNINTATNLMAILRQQVANHLGIVYTPRELSDDKQRGMKTEGGSFTMTSK